MAANGRVLGLRTLPGDPEGLTRLLKIKVISGNNLAKKDIFGASDPYVRIILYRGDREIGQIDSVSTKVIKKTLNPKWDEEFIFRVNSRDNKLLFEVFDENRVTRDDFLGLVDIPLDHVTINTERGDRNIDPRDFILRPRSSRSRVKGHLKLYLAYVNEEGNEERDSTEESEEDQLNVDEIVGEEDASLSVNQDVATDMMKGTTAKEATRKRSSESSTSSSTDYLEALDTKWSERFSRLEAMLLAQTFQQISVSVSPEKHSRVDILTGDGPFIPPPGSGSQTSSQQGAGASEMPVAQTTRPLSKFTASQAPASTSHKHITSVAVYVHHHSLTDSEVSEQETGILEQDSDQQISEEQYYRETVRGVRSFMGWHQLPEFESSASSQDDNPFANPKRQSTGKISVNLPSDDWLCRKLERLNLTLTEGYPTRYTDKNGLSKDQFVKVPHTQRWYGMHSEKKDFSQSNVNYWHNESAKLNSAFTRIARPALATKSPASRPIAQETLRKWEKSARDSTFICNQAAGFSRCLTKVQDSMATQLKVIQDEKAKGKSATKTCKAADELAYLIAFNQSVTHAMARTMQDLSDFVFINMANVTLLRRDSYLDFLKPGVKVDTVAALRNSPLHMASLFPDNVISKAEEEIAHHEDKHYTGGSHKKSDRYHPYNPSVKQTPKAGKKSGPPAWKTLSSHGQYRRGQGKASNYSQ